jgi:hypothetical protein
MMKLGRIFIIGALLCLGLVWVTQKGATSPRPNAESAAVTTASVIKPAAGGKRFTLRLGQGFRFKDSVVVVAKPDEQPDIVFKYLSPQAAGQAAPVQRAIAAGGGGIGTGADVGSPAAALGTHQRI